MLRVKLYSATEIDCKKLDHLVLYILFWFCFSLCMFNLSEYIYTCVGTYRSVTFGVCSVTRLFTLSLLVSSVTEPSSPDNWRRSLQFEPPVFHQLLRGLIQKFPDCCRHLHSSCVSAKHRWKVGQPCLASLRVKFHVGGMKWADFTRVYLDSCTWRVAIFTMDQRKEQRVCIKFCANLGKSATETLKMIQLGFGDQSLSRAQVF